MSMVQIAMESTAQGLNTRQGSLAPGFVTGFPVARRQHTKHESDTDATRVNSVRYHAKGLARCSNSICKPTLLAHFAYR